MKYQLFLFCFMLAKVSMGQIGSAQSLPEYKTIGKLINPYKYVELESNGNDYRLTFKNLEYTEISDMAVVFFTATQKELDYFYSELVKGLTMKMKDPAVTMSFGKGRIFIQRHAGSVKQVRMTYFEEGKPAKWTWLSSSQLKRVFGK